MDILLEKYVNEYGMSVDRRISGGDDHSTAYSPEIFLFIGDKAGESINTICGQINEKWDNSSGVLYFHVYSNKAQDGNNIFKFRVPPSGDDARNYRKSLYNEFYNGSGLLLELNQKIRQAKSRLLEYGRMYSCFEKVNISVVTRADDPLNILIPEITLLFKHKLSEDFKMVNTDLYCLFTEKNDDEDFGYSCAIAMAFFREIEYFQAKDYEFSAPLEVLKEGIKINVTNARSPIFELIYLLGDKNEDGIIPENAMDRNYESIVFISMLKNRNAGTGLEEAMGEVYNNDSFKKSISSDTGRQVFATAGLSKIKRPNNAIALTTLHHYFSLYVEKLKSNAQKDVDEIMRLLGLDDTSLHKKVDECMPQGCIVDEMMAIMPSGASALDIDNLTYQEAEVRLYGDSCMRFFTTNYEEAALGAIDGKTFEDSIKSSIKNNIANNPKYGLYSIYQWTSGQVVMEMLSEAAKYIQKEIDRLSAGLKEIYKQRIILTPLQRSIFGQKAALRNVKRNIIEKIYTCRLDRLRAAMKQEIIKRYEHALEDIHSEAAEGIDGLESIEGYIRDKAGRSIECADRYLGQNIEAYYGRVVESITKELKSMWGEDFYLDSRFVGNPKDTEVLMERLMENCQKYILTNPRFMESFEDELLHRANVASGYGDRVLSQEDLFKNLYSILEKNAKVSIYIMDFKTKHRYEEKYFFGDCSSPFLQYGFKVDESSRTYRLGCVHEMRSGGIGKLNLMGGFTIDSLVYARNCSKYYKTYTDEGFELHGINAEGLAVIEFN